MMHPTDDRLQDYLDDLLCREERAELEAHLVQCDVCTATVRAERELRRALNDLPRAIEPPAHVLAAINQAIDAQPLRVAAVAPRRSPWRDRTLASVRAPLAVAAMLLVMATASLTLWLARERTPPPVRAGADPAVMAVLAAEPRYVRAADELAAALDAGAHVLTPATVQLVRDHLRVIDAALAEARAALREDPNNAALAELLRAAHEQKLELLRRATRAAS